MGFRKKFAGAVLAMALVLGLSPPVASAAIPTPEYDQFAADCPWEDVEIDHCVYWVIDDGSYDIGSKTVALQNPITIQGGYSGEGSGIKFHGAESGQTLSKTPQPVPGGLAGVTAPISWPPPLQKWWNQGIEEGFTGINATLELAKPATSIGLNLENLFEESGSTLSLPVKIKLDNQLLGENCYIGSNTEPVWLELTTGSSGALTGAVGTLTFNGNFTITTLTGLTLVDGTYALPAAKGCGGIFSSFVDPLVNSIFALPSASEKNEATLEGVFEDASAQAMREP
jgi:hypothetical protein